MSKDALSPEYREDALAALRSTAEPGQQLDILIVGGGALGLGLLVPFLFYRFRKPSWKQDKAPEVTS